MLVANADGPVLAIDIGTQMGWAMDHSKDRPMTSGTISFASKRYEGGGMRYLRFSRWLDEIHTIHSDLKAVYFEEVRRHASTDAAHVYGGFLSHLSSWCELHDIPYTGVPVGTIKKHATGKGNAKKEAMIEAMEKLGYSPKDDNEADALAIAHCVRDGMA